MLAKDQMLVDPKQIQYRVPGVENWVLKDEYLSGKVSSAIHMKKKPELKCQEEGDGWCIEFVKEGIDICMYGETKKETYLAFWDYVYSLILDLEKEEKLSKDLQREKELLKEYFTVEIRSA